MTSYRTPELNGVQNEDWRPPRLSGRHGPGRTLRALIGVQENILDWVPEDRPKLTRTGAIVVCTPVMAAVSLWIALSQFLQVTPAPAIVGAVLWGVLIWFLDSWLITTSHGVIGRGRHMVLLPRLLISLVIGVLISEPLTLKIFESAITEQIKTNHQADEDQLIAAYDNCYFKQVPDMDCKPYKLNLAPPDNGALKDAIAERDKHADALKPLTKEENRLHRKWSEECAGGKFQGTSGVEGKGVACRTYRKAFIEFGENNALDAKQRKVDELEKNVKEQTEAYNNARTEYPKQVREQIAKRIAAERDKHATVPGLLERFQALDELTSRSWAIWWAHVLVAGLLILIDCFPVLSKLLSPPSAYDRTLAALLESKERLHDNDVRLNERLRTSQYEMRLLQEESRIEQAREDSDADTRLRAAGREAELQARMDEVIAQVKRARNHRPHGE